MAERFPCGEEVVVGSVIVKHRFGGHGGIATEWEIYTEALQVWFGHFPQLPFISHSGAEDKNSARGWLFLPEGVPEETVVALVDAINAYSVYTASIILHTISQYRTPMKALYDELEERRAFMLEHDIKKLDEGNEDESPTR